MRKIVVLLIAVIFCMMSVSCSHKRQPEPKGSSSQVTVEENSSENTGAKQTTGVLDQSTGVLPVVKKIKITADILKIRQDKTTDSKIIGQVKMGDVLNTLDEGKDADGKTWYKIDTDFGETGWIAGWYCEDTDDDVNRYVKSEPGQLLVDCKDSSLFVDLLLNDFFSLDQLLKKYGNTYTVSDDNGLKTYKYSNGVWFTVENGLVKNVGVDDASVNAGSIKKKTCDIYQHPGDEIIVLYQYGLYYQLLVLDAQTKEILDNYITGYSGINDFEVEDFMNDGNMELYIYGSGDGQLKRDMYQVVNDDFIKLFDINSFDLYRKGIKADIEDKTLNLDVQIGDYSANDKTLLPDRIFYNMNDTEDKNDLLSLDYDWNVVNQEGKWHIAVRYSVDFTILKYYWGSSGSTDSTGSTDNNGSYDTVLNDLARVDVLLDIDGGKPKISNITHEVKYNDPALLNVKPILSDEGTLSNGPGLGMTMEQAFESLGEDINNYNISSYMELDDVSLFAYDGKIVGITVKTDKYATKRGLKVGDTAAAVEKLYGKPDKGFSEDDYVEYRFCTEQNGTLKNDYNKVLTVHYKDNKVNAFNLYQAILN